MPASQAEDLASLVSQLEESLPDMVNTVRALALDVSALGRSEPVGGELHGRVDAQEQAAAQWEADVQQVILQIRAAT